MVFGYARVSTRGQAKDGNSLEAQENALREAGAEKIYSDAFTGTKTDRPELDKLMKVLNSGDTMVVTKLDRIARSVSAGVELIQGLINRGVKVNVLNMGILDDTPASKLSRNMFLAFAEFERDMIVTRTQEGKAIARQNPNWREGRPRKFNPDKVNLALELLETHSYREVERLTGISVSTLHNRRREREAAERSV